MKSKKIEFKSFDLKIKSMDESSGQFDGYASVFGNVDSYGDIVEQGAFLRSINSRNGKPFPVLFAHLFKEPAIGKAMLSEDAHGLAVKGQLFIDRMQKAKDIFMNMKEEVSNSMSFMYDTIQSVDATLNGQTVRQLKELKVYEVSLLNTGFGANELAEATAKGNELEAREIEKRFKTIEESLNELKSKSTDTDFQKKIEQDLKALHQTMSELVQKKDTFDKDELARALKAFQELNQSMKSI